MEFFLRGVWVSVVFSWASLLQVNLAASEADNQRLFRQATVQFRKHGEVCVCKDCRELKALLKSRGLLPGRLGEKPASRPLFEGQGIPQTRPAPAPTPPTRAPSVIPAPRPAVAASFAKRDDREPGAGGRMVRVTRGKPLHPFRPVVFPRSSVTAQAIVSPSANSAAGVLGPRRVHGARLADPRPRPVAVLAVPASSPTVAPKPVAAPPAVTTAFPVPVASPVTPRPLPSAVSRPISVAPVGVGSLPGRPVSAGGLPGRPIAPRPGVSSGLPGRPIPISSGLPGRPVPSTSNGSSLPGRPLPPASGGSSLPGRPIPPR